MEYPVKDILAQQFICNRWLDWPACSPHNAFVLDTKAALVD